MNDLKPFKHGEEGTHAVCNKHNIGDKSVCCECMGKTDCSDMQNQNEMMEEFMKWWSLGRNPRDIADWWLSRTSIIEKEAYNRGYEQAKAAKSHENRRLTPKK